MSDEEVQTKAPSKRGRKPNPEKAAAKKVAAKNEIEDEPPVKRGRGRPKGTGKKPAATAKTNGTTAAKGKRGRKKKEEKKEDSSAEEEENGKSSENEEDEDDD
ncbi:high mobility group protein HMG-I/HMG-Y-like isoform X2 [Anthonomus grandis grandis]|uniref:high mobility group protein HMG-I/HMG-Y-like isoform X2 n=1 Tax=Anthonomus grandis grandis TaxID=2921223 RepID=UPI002165C606|nr:high mobility group protein HMG-I/HMG-Y-like isoform X2 [Anthonomus grandis grandis]XP_050305780.1 high mobility group protein HMG-I/HMG-Y-like isoform X2 [Anthonomus grandis grandis]